MKFSSSQEVKKAVTELKEALVKNPKDAKAKYVVDVKWNGGVSCTAVPSNNKPFHFDEPKSLGGFDEAPSPVDYILGALGACQEIVYSAFASAMDIKIDKLEVSVTGHIDFNGMLGLDNKALPGLTDISYETNIWSSASEIELKALVEAVETACPILDTLKRPISTKGAAVFHKPDEKKAS